MDKPVPGRHYVIKEPVNDKERSHYAAVFTGGLDGVESEPDPPAVGEFVRMKLRVGGHCQEVMGIVLSDGDDIEVSRNYLNDGLRGSRAKVRAIGYVGLQIDYLTESPKLPEKRRKRRDPNRRRDTFGDWLGKKE